MSETKDAKTRQYQVFTLQPRPVPPQTAIYRIVRRIPRGRVATYGQIARLADLPGHARLVGYAMHAAAESTRIPWHRVINAQGRISARSDGPGASVLQRLLLEREGVTFDATGRVSLNQFGWTPRERRRS